MSKKTVEGGTFIARIIDKKIDYGKRPQFTVVELERRRSGILIPITELQAFMPTPVDRISSGGIILGARDIKGRSIPGPVIPWEVIESRGLVVVRRPVKGDKYYTITPDALLDPRRLRGSQ